MPHKSSHSPEMGQHKGPATTVSKNLLNVSMKERPLVQGVHRKGWGGGFTVTIYSWKNRTERLNILLGSKGNYGQGVVSVCPECQPSSVGTGQQQKGAELCPQRVPSARGGCSPAQCLLWGCYWSLWSKGVSQACW